MTQVPTSAIPYAPPFAVPVELINRYVHDIADRTDNGVLSIVYTGQYVLTALVGGEVMTASGVWLQDALAVLWPQVVVRRPNVFGPLKPVESQRALEGKP